ncbi:MAG: ATP-binding protein [Chloroflexia bacterium]
MTLRRKLLTIVSALALTTLVVAGMTWWTTVRWSATDAAIQGHYQQSLEVQRVRATMFRAYKEVSDSVTGGDSDAREEFEALIRVAERDFETWESLAETNEERRQVEEVRTTYDSLVTNARRVFDLMDAGRGDEAFAVMEGPLEDSELQSFQDATERAVASDRQNRTMIRVQTANTRRAAQMALAIGAFGTLSLTLLLAAYVGSDLFSPLREVGRGLRDVAHGDLSRRLPEERADEIGEVNREFNRMVDAVERRVRIAGGGALAQDVGGEMSGDESWRDSPSRVTLHRLVTQLRAGVAQLGREDESSDEREREVLTQLDSLSQVVARVTEFGFPLDLNLARTDIRALLYDVLVRFHSQLAERGISIEFDIEPEVGDAMVDRLKLREAVAELVRNSMAALPTHGGRIGIRARLGDNGGTLLIEVIDDGQGAPSSSTASDFDGRNAPKRDGSGAAFYVERNAPTGRPRVGLAITRSIVEQHGGSLTLETLPDQGTYTRIHLPLRS